MSNKKGFTLVELLAVIAILAILVIIALPNVLKMFRNAKQNTFVTEVQNLVRSAENKYLSDSMNNLSNTCFDSKTNPLDMTGRDNLIYKIKLSDKGQILEVHVRDSEYELIASSTTGINREELGKGYKVSEAKTSITDCNGNSLSEGEEVKKKYVDKELNGADPVLGSGMIPVMLSDTGVVTYAHDYDEWYSYKDKEWANAVILVDNPSKSDYKAGDIISESDIRGYFVWIPKYSYRIFNMGNYDNVLDTKPESQVQEIDIVFGTRTTGETEGECITPMESGLSKADTASEDCDEGDLMTHPAFLSIPSNGFWVGKFEAGYNQNNDVKEPITDISAWSKKGAQITEEYTIGLENKIIVKPNVNSWRNQIVATFFQSLYNFNRTLDSHMIKNTEWGAVAYLSHSKYGIEDEVRINNNSNYLTGYAADEESAKMSDSTNKQWNTETGYLASTTGNITGVYDMSGCAWEYTAAYMTSVDLTTSGMNTIVGNTLYSKYLDKYSQESTKTSFVDRILGDATGELGPFYNDGSSRSTWYSDFGYFVDSAAPWFPRGGCVSDTISAGQFCIPRSTGGVFTFGGSRLILTPTN